MPYRGPLVGGRPPARRRPARRRWATPAPRTIADLQERGQLIRITVGRTQGEPPARHPDDRRGTQLPGPLRRLPRVTRDTVRDRPRRDRAGRAYDFDEVAIVPSPAHPRPATTSRSPGRSTPTGSSCPLITSADGRGGVARRPRSRSAGLGGARRARPRGPVDALRRPRAAARRDRLAARRARRPALLQRGLRRADQARADRRADQADARRRRDRRPRALSPQRTAQYAQDGRSTPASTCSSSGARWSPPSTSSARAEPLNLKQFIDDLDVPVIVGGVRDLPDGAAPDAHRRGRRPRRRRRRRRAHDARRPGHRACRWPPPSPTPPPPAATTSTSPAAATCTSSPTAACGTGGDIAKAIACGADAVMLGAPLARAAEAPGRGWHWGAEAHHPSCPAASASHAGTVGTLRADPVRTRSDSPTARPTCSARCAAPWRRPATPSQGVPARRGRRHPVRSS